MLKLGFIGNGNHAKRLIRIAASFDFCRVASVYHPRNVPKTEGGTSVFQDLLVCDVIFITSPNSTHVDYLLKLEKCFSGYVFCEKPLANNLADLKRLSRLDPKRHFFGFNLRYSDLASWAQQGIKDGDIGQPIRADVVLTHGFAFKNQYQQSWKSSSASSPAGILENVAIHYVDLLATILGDISEMHTVAHNFSGTGTVADTATINTHHRSGASGSILVSYSAPLCDSFSLIGTNGLLKFDSDVLRLLSPRDTFDPAGMFAPPPVLREKIFSRDALYEQSLQNEMAFFLICCHMRGAFEPNLFTRSLESTRATLDARA